MKERRQSGAEESAAALLAAAQQMVTAARQARFDVDDAAAAAGRLSEAVRRLCDATAAVLAWWDGFSSAQVAAARRQVGAALSDLGHVGSVQRLQPAVKVAVSELRRFVELCQQLGGELPCDRSRRLLAAQLRHILLCAQLLPAAAVCRCVHPLNSYAKMPLDLAVRGLTESAAEAADLLCTPTDSRRPGDSAAADGGFVRSTDGLLRLLERCPQPGFAAQAQPLLEEFLAHALAVGQCAGGSEGERVSRACQQVLEQFSAAASLQGVTAERRGEFVLACQLLADQLELAEHLVNSALLRLIVDTFTEPTQQLDALVRAASCEAPDGPDLEWVVVGHDLAADRVFQVCGLATACSTDADKLTLIRAGLLMLETLEPEVYPAATLLRAAPNDPAARQHLAAIRDRWRLTLMEVRDCLDQIMDPLAFCKAVEAAQTALAARMKDMLYDQVTDPLLELAGKVISLGLRLGQFMMDQVRGFPHITEAVLLVNRAVSQLPGSVRSVAERPADLGAHRLLQKVVQVVVTYVHRLRVLLESQDDEQTAVLDGLGDVGEGEAAGAASQTLLSDVNQLPVDETRPLCSRVRSRLAASSRTFNSERSRHGATVANTELSLDISKYLSFHSQGHRNASLRLRAVRVDLTPLVPRAPPVSGADTSAPQTDDAPGPAPETGPTLGPDPEPPEEMLALDADEVAAELSSLSELIDAQPATDLSHILDSLSELAAELSQDVRDTERSLRLAPAAAVRRQRAAPPPPAGRQPPGWPTYGTAGGGAETCVTPSCGGGQLSSRPGEAEPGRRAAPAAEGTEDRSERSATEC
ncbi:uncharacterized protein LOC122387018 isoform X2 [Amphibalanus amphitrite]|nr:uncharacterized protein LOC122387018 isoform X2 [Amphibalanus amphitrite]